MLPSRLAWRCPSSSRVVPGVRRGYVTAPRAPPDILQCESCSLFRFGEPTSESEKALFKDLNWRIKDKSEKDNYDAAHSSAPEAWAVIGARGRELVDAAVLGRARADPPSSRQWPFIGTSKQVEDVIRKVAFNTRLESNSYLAQSGEFTDYTARYYGIRKDDEDAITLHDHLRKYASLDGVSSANQDKSILQTATTLRLNHLLRIPLIALSNGQTRRARIARALLTRPGVLVLEEPFTGLDVGSRKLIADLLGELHRQRNPRILLVLRPQDEVPAWVDRIVMMGEPTSQTPTYLGRKDEQPESSRSAKSPKNTLRLAAFRGESTGAATFVLNKGNVRYNDRHILKDVTWKARSGDRTVLTGANGSGKSTLLSLVLGDHPASYTQDLTIFDKPRGAHSTYSLSKDTGHYSPELFASFPRRYGEAGLSLYEVIGSGFENVFTYRKLSESQKTRLEELLTGFDPDKNIFPDNMLHQTLFAEAEPSLQAVTLLLRAMVKRPKLLILDEPFSGMNPELVQQCRSFIDNQLGDEQALVFVSHYEEEWPTTINSRIHLVDGASVAP